MPPGHCETGRLPDQVAGQVHVALAHREHRLQVGGFHRTQQVEDRAFLEEAGGETGKRTEQQCRLTIDNSGVQVWHRHGRRPDRRLAVDLGIVLLNNVRLATHQPLTADRETAVAPGFLDTGFLQ